MKRKMGFGFAPLKLISRSNKSKPAEDAVLDAEDDLDFPLDSSFINRPPPLDPKTERELWKACAVILQNLKPSGWDIEDTRMRSDMLVDDADDEEIEPTALAAPRAARLDPPMQLKGPRSKPLVVHAVQNDKGEGVRPANGAEPARLEAKQLRSAARGHAVGGSGMIPQQDFESPRLDFLPQLLQLEALESPVVLSQAPPGSARASNTRQTTADERDRPPAAQRVNSSSTLASSHYSRANSTNDINTTSTGFTSAAYTPDVSSKRVSEQAHSDPTNTSRSTTGAGGWMKEEVDKRRQTETPTNAIIESTKITTTGPSHRTPATTSDAQDSRDPQIHSRTVTPDVRYRDSQSSFSRPRSNGAPRERRRADDSPGAAAASSHATELNKNVVTDGRDSQDQPTARSPTARGDPQLDRPQTPQRSREIVPPVPALPAARSMPDHEQQLPSRTVEKANTFRPINTEGNDSGLSSAQGSEARTADLQSNTRTRLSPTSPSFPPISLRPLSDASSDSRASQKSRHTSRDSTTQRYQLMPLKHHDDESILVKDFWKPSVRRSGTKPRNVQTIDIQAADFDDLMSFMKDTKETIAAVGRDSLSSCNTSLVNSYADSVINKQRPLQTQQLVPPTGTASQVSTDRTRSLTSLNHHGPPHRPTHNAAVGGQSSVHNGLVSPASLSPSFHSKPASLNERRGIKRVLNRLAGGDASQQRSVYIPPAGPRYSEAEEDEWYDSQACAAPVVGFGRGW